MGKRVLVTGGSVAANTLAWWLAEGGFNVTVIEKAPKFREGGQSIDVRGAGRIVLDDMGVREEVERNGTGETGWTYVDEKGKVVAAFELEDVGGDGPTAELEILRGDLARIMYEKVRDRVDYRFGDSIAAIDDREDAAHVRFESGRATPVSGIGTTLAVVGAYVLAGELANTDGYAEAFRRYENIMRPFVKQGQSVSKLNQLWTHPHTKFGIAAQHAALNVLSKPGIRDVFLSIGMRDSEDIDLPKYPFGGTPVAGA